MVILSNNTLTFRFPDIHEKAACSIEFKRTLRIPDDNRSYNLPPGLGTFPLLHVEDYSDTIPDSWRERGGVFLPMYQAEALWISFGESFLGPRYPCAVKVAAGKINAVTGESWTNGLSTGPQDYVVVPEQPWLDGYSVGEGLIRQFVAMTLGDGYTAEEQITGEAEFGGLQISVTPMKKEVYDDLFPPRPLSRYSEEPLLCRMCNSISEYSMGMAPGGLMRQEIYDDKYGVDVWDTSATSRCFVHLSNSLAYRQITGKNPPTKAPTAQQYTDSGLPWFDYYAAELKALKGSQVLAGLDSVAAKTVKRGNGLLGNNASVDPERIVTIKDKGRVQDGCW